MSARVYKEGKSQNDKLSKNPVCVEKDLGKNKGKKSLFYFSWVETSWTSFCLMFFFSNKMFFKPFDQCPKKKMQYKNITIHVTLGDLASCWPQ